MTETRRMEDLSITYLSAIAAQASVDFEFLHHDEDSVDCLLKKVVVLEGGGQFRSSLHVQLKSTASKNLYTIGENEIILCLLVLPEEAEKPWVECTDDELLLHGRMYWCSLRNRPDATQKDRVPVELPKDQFLDPNMLDRLMLRVAGGDLS